MGFGCNMVALFNFGASPLSLGTAASSTLVLSTKGRGDALYSCRLEVLILNIEVRSLPLQMLWLFQQANQVDSMNSIIPAYGSEFTDAFNVLQPKTIQLLCKARLRCPLLVPPWVIACTWKKPALHCSKYCRGRKGWIATCLRFAKVQVTFLPLTKNHLARLVDDPNVQLEEMDFQDFEAVKNQPRRPEVRAYLREKSGLRFKMLHAPIEPSFHDSYGRVEAVGRDLEGFGRWAKGAVGEKASQNRCHFFRFVLISMLGYADRYGSNFELILTSPWEL